MLDIDRERELARDAYTSGHIDEAISKQRGLINEQAVAAGEVLITDYRQLAFFLIAGDRSREAVETLLPVIEARPDNADLLAILGLVYTNLRQHDRAITYLKRALAVDRMSFTAADQLTRCYLAKGELATAKHFGELALNIKDALYRGEQNGAKGESLVEAPPSFSENKKKQNIIAFSLWGTNHRYLTGALRNCELAAVLYPGWQCRFYVDKSVPENVIKNLGARGADVREMPTPKRLYDGLFWRFLVASDSKIKRFLVRDCDSVLNVKERVAVEAWLQSDKHFHVMRDYYTHTDLVLAGMWGGVTGVIENIEEMIRTYTDGHIQSRVMDQTFLNECLWPIIRQSCIVHDSCFDTDLSSNYPPYCDLPPGRHIGQDEFSYLKAQRK